MSPRLPVESSEKSLRLRLDGVMGRLHELTKRRDAGDLSIQASLPLELSLVIELGHLQDRLRLLGCHTYDGCPECRPGIGDKSNASTERNDHGL